MGNYRMPHTSALRRLGASLALTATALLLVLAACSAGGAATSSVTTHSTPTPAGCATVPGFEHATTPPSAGAHFTDVGYPVGASGYATAAPEANGFQYRIVHVCAPGSSPAMTSAFYSTNLTAHTWATTATFPSAGDLSTACPHAPDCYIKNDGVIRFLTIEDAATSGPLATYALRLVIQPYAFGGALVSSGDQEDFDPTGPGGGTNDVTWNGMQLVPVGSAKLAGAGLMGSLNTLSYADTSALPFAAAPIAGSALVPGYVFGVATSDGHVAKVRVVSHTGTQLNIEYVTYAYTF